ncbi:vWA domain-containing protein [Sporobolomyces salmoneus]|uniref:vWA domain-containing protein n=1 Tax=Sporobolomyces salmoneus TaxID=183962 RepID=UPI00316CF27A
MEAALEGINYTPFAAPQVPERMLDLVFILDCTGSMGSYIASATKNIELICDNIIQSGRLTSAESLRVGLIAYRDYPPQDNSYITKSFPFDSSVQNVKEHLKTLYASGGGDGPEGVTAGMKAALELDWRQGAAKMAVLIADAPCHGIGEYGDGFPTGGPDGEDPLLIARQMASQGIPLFVVACEPALSGYQFGLDFFRALTIITSALLVPLTTAALLSHVIVGASLEHLEMERLIQEVGRAVAERIHLRMQTVDDVARELHEKLLLRGEETKQLQFESIHRETDETKHNVETFVNAPDLQSAKPLLQKVRGSRFTEKYLQSRYNSSFARGSSMPDSLYPALPPRPGTTTTASATSYSGFSTLGGGGRSPPSSPPRRVVSEFKPFAAGSGLSVADAPLGFANENNSPQGGDELAQSVELRFAGISLEQAKRITIASAWRTAPPRA